MITFIFCCFPTAVKNICKAGAIDLQWRTFWFYSTTNVHIIISLNTHHLHLQRMNLRLKGLQWNETLLFFFTRSRCRANMITFYFWHFYSLWNESCDSLWNLNVLCCFQKFFISFDRTHDLTCHTHTCHTPSHVAIYNHPTDSLLITEVWVRVCVGIPKINIPTLGCLRAMSPPIIKSLCWG